MKRLTVTRKFLTMMAWYDLICGWIYDIFMRPYFVGFGPFNRLSLLPRLSLCVCQIVEGTIVATLADEFQRLGLRN